MANSYHSISVGLRSGNHSLGGSTADGTGRMKPDLVVNETATSYAGPAVASVAAMLRQAIKAGYTAADNPRTIKAILLAGASKTNLPGWQRASSGRARMTAYSEPGSSTCSKPIGYSLRADRHQALPRRFHPPAGTAAARRAQT